MVIIILAWLKEAEDKRTFNNLVMMLNENVEMDVSYNKER